MTAQKTIDRWILDTLLSFGPMAKFEIARALGEDRVRISEWVEKLRKLGLVRLFHAEKKCRVTTSGPYVSQDVFEADRGAVAAHLANHP